MASEKAQSQGQFVDWKDSNGNEKVPLLNSVTSPALWAQFTRAVNASGKHHPTLQPWYLEDKRDMFTTWVYNAKDGDSKLPEHMPVEQ